MIFVLFSCFVFFYWKAHTPAQRSVQMTEDSYYILEDLHKHAEDDKDTPLFTADHLDMFCLVSRLDEVV